MRDPVAGQTWRKGKRTRTVLAIAPFARPENIGVHFRTPSQPKGEISWVSMEYWLSWAEGAELIDDHKR